MITEEHFVALREVREAARCLGIACTALAGASALVHMAFDRTVSSRLSRREELLLGKLRIVK